MKAWKGALANVKGEISVKRKAAPEGAAEGCGETFSVEVKKNKSHATGESGDEADSWDAMNLLPNAASDEETSPTPGTDGKPRRGKTQESKGESKGFPEERSLWSKTKIKPS